MNTGRFFIEYFFLSHLSNFTETKLRSYYYFVYRINADIWKFNPGFFLHQHPGK